MLQQPWPLHEQFGGHRATINEWGLRWAPTAHPILRYYWPPGAAWPSRAATSRTGSPTSGCAWREIAGDWNAVAQLALPVHMDAVSSRCFVMGRIEAFRPGEVRLARRLHRLLSGLDRQVQALRRIPSRAPSGAWQRAESVRLTPRELGVLGLVAEGLTAAAVARRLLLAERTVRKHLERVYAKLGVSDRVSAVLRAQQLGLVGAPGTVRPAATR